MISVRREVPAVNERLTTYERRENIKMLLIKERATTTLKLAYMFGVSKPTILNDIVFLSSRLPIITKSGNGGGIFLDMKFDNPREYLLPEEESLLLKLMNFADEQEKKLLINIINKFSLQEKK